MSTTIAELGAENWKLIRALERTIAMLPVEARERLKAHARYAEGRLDALLAREGLRVVSFDGAPFEVNLPAIAINGDDIADDADAVVERTIEPAIVSDTRVVLSGRVFLIAIPRSSDVSRD